MNLREDIRRNLRVNKINVAQLDPNGLCNSKCWYCPVKYKGNPKEFINQMPIDDVEHILQNIRNSSLLSNNFTDILLNNFNEIFLYKYFDKLIELLGKYKFTTLILTNCTTLNDEHIKIILNNKNIIRDLWIHIPIFDRELWKEQTGLTDKLFDRLCKNLDELHGKVNATVHLSGVNDGEYSNIFQKKYNNSIILKEDRFEESRKKFISRYPKFKIEVDFIIDRAGILSEYSAFKNENLLPLTENEIVSGCNFLYGGISRLFNWLTINSVGDVFLCCNDFDMKYRFGNLLQQSLDECWQSEQHIDAIIDIFNDNCSKCIFRQKTFKNYKPKLI
jgi:radical SAM protein with 4Fe4S-binding SPASM domain